MPTSPSSGPPTLFEARPGESPDAIDRRWRAEVYQGDRVRQLTWPAALTGMALGAVMAVSNLYVGLKAGWSLGVAITACLLSFLLWRTLSTVGIARRPLSILEHNCVQSTASAAGFSTGAAMITAIPAYLMITGVQIRPIWMFLWVFFLALMGVAMAIPIKRQLIHYEQLKFPSAIAAAQMLQSLHRQGEAAVRQARALFAAMGVGAVAQWCIGNGFRWWPLPALPDPILFPGSLAGRPLAAYTVGIDGSTVYLAAGAILGLRVTVWMLVGSALSYLVLAPLLAGRGLLEEVGYRGIQSEYSLWIGAALMVAASLMSLLFQRRLIGRALRGLAGLWRRRPEGEDPLADVEAPGSWFVLGVLGAGFAVTVVADRAFAIDWWMSVLAILLSFLFVMVACRATGETDITPVGALGKITQLGYGVVAPRSLTTNLMTASITTSAAASAADLMTDLKCGYLLGANTRQQTLAQLLGVVVGTLVVVPAFYLLVPTAETLGTSAFPAPAAQAWRFVAELLAHGIGALSPVARLGMALGAIGGVLLSTLEHARPAWRRWLPSPFGLGMGMVIFFSNSLSFFLGAAAVALLTRARPALAERYVVPVSSGLIAGESLMGVLLAALVALGVMGG